MKNNSTYKAERWKITYTNELGKSYNHRFTYMQMGFDSEVLAQNELKKILKAPKEGSSNEDYRVEKYIANMLFKPIYPFNDNEKEV